MASYDQLNLPSLASAEGLNRRRALIEMAHQGRPEAPSYEGADEILGVREATDGTIVDPALTQHAARRQAAKAEILKQNRLAAEEERHAGRRNEERTRTSSPTREARPAERATRIRAPAERGGGRRLEGALPQTAELFSANQFSDEPVSRFGDLFPLPLPADDDGFVGDLGGLASRSSRQRVGRALHRRETDSVRALNFLSGYKDESQWPSGCLNQAQQSAIERIRRAHKERAPAPDSMSSQTHFVSCCKRLGLPTGKGSRGKPLALSVISFRYLEGRRNQSY